MDFKNIQIKPIAPALGAEIAGVDLFADLDDAVVAEIRRALLRYRVIFFRDQDFTPEQHLAFARKFGALVDYPMVSGLDGYPDIVPVVKLEDESHNFGGIWHSDTTYLAEPPMGAILAARELPPQGGDTMFANMVMAYDALSDGMKAMLEGLTAINSSAKGVVAKSREARQKGMNDVPDPLVAEHPVVRTHPETGEKILYVNIGHTVGIRGMADEESGPLLEFLFRHQRHDEFSCRFSWAPGSVAFWDNRSTQHYPLNDYHGFKRVMHRITLAGDVPV
ncbi:MAG: TauD/TfdA family dioxygenase [Rhodospirillales bacterium]|nr:TauD/TfdA family dioxygenase [Alphaproteobacteria bacterium]MBL6947205.1 TauD/TfdA family dioxygenase [Rhodospirillales bacterium]